MWNGFWKLTVMVGVIGIGLFAVYQAQKGMSRMADSTSADHVESNTVPVDPLYERSQILDPSKDESQTVSLTDSNWEQQPRSAKRSSKESVEDRIDLVGNFTTEQPAVKAVMASSKNPSRIVPVNRLQHQQGLSFREDEEPIDEISSTRTRVPQQLPDDDPVDELTSTPASQLQQPAEEDSVDGANEAPESTSDPFADAAAPITDSVNPLNDEPGRARLTTDFDNRSDIPKSRRAKVSAGRRTESSVEAESNPFDSEPKSTSSPPLVVSDSPASDGLPALGTPELLHESTGSDPFAERNPHPSSAPRSLPSDPPTSSDDDTPPVRSRPLKNPSPLPADLGGEMLDAPPPRSREPLKRRADPDRVTPVDMVGDGVIGDASQRGIQQPRVTIEKVAQQQAVLDQPLIYTIIVKNTGTVDAHNVVIEDRIPKGTELLGTSPRAELVGKRLIWNELVLKPNEEKKISIKVVPKQEGPIGSVARVYFATEVSAEIVVAAPQLEFTVKAPREVRIGQSFDLVFNLKNVGKVEANNISVRDFVPDHLKHEAGIDIECPIGKLAPNEVREIVLPVTAIKTGSIINRAILTADSAIKKELDSPIDIVGEMLVLTRSGHNRLYVERPAVFTNNIRNDGNLQVSKVRVSEVVPAGMEFETASDGGKYDSNQRAVVWTVGPLAPGDDKSVTIKYVPKETGTHGGKITATGATGSTAAVDSMVEVIGKPELQMETLSATGVVTVGDRITSKFQLRNTGTAAAHNVQLRVRLPRELRLVSVRGANYQQKDDNIVFEPINELAPRMNAAYELILEPIEEADARIGLEISAEHLSKPHRREETIQIAADALK